MKNKISGAGFKALDNLHEIESSAEFKGKYTYLVIHFVIDAGELFNMPNLPEPGPPTPFLYATNDKAAFETAVRQLYKDDPDRTDIITLTVKKAKVDINDKVKA